MKKFSLIIAAVVLFGGASFAQTKTTKTDKSSKTEKKTTKTEKKAK